MSIATLGKGSNGARAEVCMGYARGGRIPADVTSFVGRESELAEVHGLVRRARMITLVGPGGVGKTRLALRAARELRDAYADGVHLVELSGHSDAGLLANAVSEALGLPEQAGRPQIDAVVEHVAERELLLVLDTCEHLLDACALLADLLLPQAPRLTLLATSRQALDVPGEHILPVPPLTLPDRSGTGCEALTLFAQRAAAVVPGFTLTDANREQATALCRRLDGIPLAIELAAVRLRALPLEQLVARLTDTFALLDGGRMTTLPRHQTLRTTIGWSHELCSPEERLLWARLSVFAGSFDLAAAEAVCADAELPAGSVLEHLISLVDKSVVLRVGENGTRYRLLDTIREYGAEWLSSAGGGEAVRLRHIALYRSRLRHLVERFLTPEQLTLHRELAADQENLRAALGYAAEAGGGRPLALTAVMWAHWTLTGSPAEAVHWMRPALAADAGAPADRVATLVWYSAFQTALAAASDGTGAAEEAVRIADGLGDDGLRAAACAALGIARTYAGDARSGTALLRQADELARAYGDPLVLANTSLRLSIVHLHALRPDEALAACDRTMEVLGEGSPESFVQAYSLNVRGVAHMLRGELPEAGRALRRCAELHGQRDDVHGLANALSYLGWITVREGRHRRAAWLFGAAGAQWALVGQRILAGNRLQLRTHEYLVSAAREHLGEQRYVQLYAQGARLDLARAVEFVTGDADALPADQPPGAPRGASGGRTDALTRREREVAALVAQGLSNREIAQRLVISKRTADAHVEHILAKLGFSSRSEIAALVSRDGGLVSPPAGPNT
ncbi:LuxR C-terminal-related transcriptional regulator [Streptomyces sp. NPDC051940]|uniref:LuxR C-terminal-related transcriptional regulator n=1 Tax=Streptomyces sp. NPDC051940 TaxID=3155675 RepID=UPI00344AAC15